MFIGFPAAHVYANLGNDLEGCSGVDTVYTGEINPGHAQQRFVQTAPGFTARWVLI